MPLFWTDNVWYGNLRNWTWHQPCDLGQLNKVKSDLVIWYTVISWYLNWVNSIKHFFWCFKRTMAAWKNSKVSYDDPLWIYSWHRLSDKAALWLKMVTFYLGPQNDVWSNLKVRAIYIYDLIIASHSGHFEWIDRGDLRKPRKLKVKFVR